MLWHSRRKTFLFTHLWSLCISKAKQLLKAGMDSIIFLWKNKKYFWKHCVFILLTECKSNSTTTSQICVSCCTKWNCNICSRTFFHFMLHMHTQKKQENEWKICNVIDKDLQSTSQELIFQVLGFMILVYLSPTHYIWQRYPQLLLLLQWRLQLSAAVLQPKWKSNSWIQSARAEKSHWKSSAFSSSYLQQVVL